MEGAFDGTGALRLEYGMGDSGLTRILEEALTAGASDVHFSAGEKPMMRVHGHMENLGSTALAAETIENMVFGTMTNDQRAFYLENMDIDYSMQFGERARFRVNVFRQQRGTAAVFRRIPTKILSCDDLGLPDAVRALTRRTKGLVLVTGPTGSGKSTTLAAMIDLINETEKGHILTIEDPLEFVHKNKQCLVSQREIGSHSKSFANALRAALREDPDVILVGEMRDLETIQLALTAAETGHLVFGTLHTSSAPKTVDRIIDVFPTVQQAQVRTMLAESLEGVISQVLLPRVGGGRVAAIEILLGTNAVRNLIRTNKIFQIPSVMQTSVGLGMQPMKRHLGMLYDEGLISDDTFNEMLGLDMDG